MPGRPRTFDPDEALAAAVRLFWEKGYEATGMNDLVEVMGVHKGSLYKTFGDKEALFLAALRRYMEQNEEQIEAGLAGAATASEALQRYLNSAVEACAGTDGQPGCFAINALVEMAPGNDKARALLQEFADRKLERLAGLLAAGQDDGSIRSDIDARDLALQFMAVGAGMMVFLRSGVGDPAALAATFLGSLQAPR